MATPRFLAIHHVQLAIPPGGEDRARAFYGDVLGLLEVEKPAALAGRNSIWFAAGAVSLHIAIEPDFHPARRAHPALLIEGLDAILTRCEAAGIVTKPDAYFNGLRRFHVFDPFGNRLELMERSA
jgi:catechol 2,3-dioxygenase-like lactoylglutathione lyase family enzyme